MVWQSPLLFTVRERPETASMQKAMPKLSVQRVLQLLTCHSQDNKPCVLPPPGLRRPVPLLPTAVEALFAVANGALPPDAGLKPASNCVSRLDAAPETKGAASNCVSRMVAAPVAKGAAWRRASAPARAAPLSAGSC
mmetsp:Transcript_31796/g.62514  ORF Transcript_31796/g.62514 Transcript_31796/m.62514 type:complete len:137 (+) Transcript_31796:41-451(+)